MESDSLSIRWNIQITPDALFCLYKQYKCNFDLCDIGILYVLDGYYPTNDSCIMTKEGVEYYKISIISIIDWFQQLEAFTDKAVRKSIVKLVRCGAIIMPRGTKYHIEDDFLWFFETDELWQLLDPIGYTNAKSYSAWLDSYNSNNIHTNVKKEHVPGPEGWVYCFYNSLTGYSKIGMTKKLDQRKYSLECSSGVPLDFLAAMKCSDYGQCEHKLHVLFSENRMTGEWFSLDKPIRDNMRYYFEHTANENGYIISEWKESV